MNLQTKTTNLSQDPLEVFSRLAASHDYCFLLETLADKYEPQTTSQSYIGVAPGQHYAARDGVLYVDGQPASDGVANPYELLREYISFDTGLPKGYIGGLVGYFSHEAIHYIEPSLEFPYGRDFCDFEVGRYDDGLVFHKGEPTEYFHYGEDRLSLYEAGDETAGELSIKFMGAAKNSGQYGKMIDKARDDIQNGRVFQVVLANKYEYSFEGDLVELYKELRRINPSPFMFFMKFGDTVTLGASPELLSHTTPTGEAYLEALAGTIRRGGSDAADAVLAKQLLADEKEVAEHSMLVDLARNDLGRICRIGSVKVDKLMYIKKTSHVQHISSLVSGRLAAGRTAFDTLAASFPAGTLSGAPKIEAIKMITELEGYERGPYGGTVGYFSYSGDSEQAVNIRSVSTSGDKLLLHSGSGIVYDSRAEREQEEINEKKAAMDRAMKPFLTGEKS
jgi:anthranilate synthase component 1